MPITALGDWCINYGNDWRFNDHNNMSDWDNTKYTLVVFIEFSHPCQDEIVNHYLNIDNIQAGKLPENGIQLQYKANLDVPSCNIFLTDLPYMLDETFIYKVKYYSPCLDGCTTPILCSGLSYRPFYQGIGMSIGVTGGAEVKIPLKFDSGLCNGCQ